MNKNTIFNFASAAFAFVVWGGWAYWVNSKDGTIAGITSGLVQGISSFLITLAMIHSIRFFMKQFNNNFYQIIFPPLMTSSITGLFLVMVHLITGTQYLLKTVLPAIIVGFIFCLLTVFKYKGASHGK